MEKSTGASGQKRAIKQDRAVQTRKEILEAAIKLFARKGLLATTMADLARAISMTPGALYWHFPTKEDLVLAAVEELELRYREAWKTLTTEGRKRSAAEQLAAFYFQTMSFVREHRHYGMFLGMLAAESVELSGPVAEALRRSLEIFTSTLAGIIRYGQEKTGEFHRDVDAKTLAQAAIASHLGAVIYFNLHESTVSYDAMFDSLEKVTLAGLRRRDDASGG